MKMGNINVYSKVVRRSTCGGLGTDNWLWGILKPRTNANGNLEKKKDAETEVGTEVHEKNDKCKRKSGKVLKMRPNVLFFLLPQM